MIKPKLYKGQRLKGTWDVTLKLDGVRVLFTEEGPVSRAGKPLYNIPTSHNLSDAEVFMVDWATTVSKVRSHNGEQLPLGCLYSLSPLDPRLLITTLTDPTTEQVSDLLKEARQGGNEGLVLRQGDTWLKVKPEETYDLVVTGQIEGTGKYVGMLGAVTTELGNVGTGFTDADRSLYWGKSLVGSTIEVSAMEKTPDGKLRHPRFVRERFDK